MYVIIDLGTSRTAIAITGEHSNWQTFSQPQKTYAGPETPVWGRLRDLIDGVGGMQLAGMQLGEASIPHLLTYSRYCAIDGLVIPTSLDGALVAFPAGARVVPPALAQGGEFPSVKQDPSWAQAFLSALTKIVRTWAPPGAQWVIGQSRGGIDPSRLPGLPAGSQTFNEATAVIFALVALDNGRLLHNSRDKFVVLADLGGGFLDVSVAHNVDIGEHEGTAEIVNYGGYPLGVDRVGTRFSRSAITNAEWLTRLIVVAIAYHIWDYLQRDAHKTSGVICLTGGGFLRLGGLRQTVANELHALVQRVGESNVTVELLEPQYDTKYLTIAGLARLAKLGNAVRTAQLGDDISDRNPHYHGQQILAVRSIDPALSDSWYSLVDDQRRAVYQR